MFLTVKLKSAIAIFLVGCLVVWGGVSLMVPAQSTFSEGQERDVPIIMYHHILKDSNRWGKYVIGPEELEQDLRYLKAQGYETVTAEDVIRFVYEGTPLPQKPIMLTFDDGYYSNFVYACPLLQQYGMKGVLSVIGQYTDEYSRTGEENPNYSHVTWEHCREMIRTGTMELQNHTYGMHRFSGTRQGCTKKRGETLWQYHAALLQDLKKLQLRFQQETNYLPRAFTYPFGLVSPESMEVLKELGFLAAFTCTEGINTISPDNPDGLYQLKRYLRPSGMESALFFQKIENKK